MPTRTHPARVWIEDHLEELRKKYPGEWVAANADGVVFHSKDVDTLVEEIQKASYLLWDFRLENVKGSGITGA